MGGGHLGSGRVNQQRPHCQHDPGDMPHNPTLDDRHIEPAAAMMRMPSKKALTRGKDLDGR